MKFILSSYFKVPFVNVNFFMSLSVIGSRHLSLVMSLTMYMGPETEMSSLVGYPDQTFDILLIGFDVKIRSKNLIRVRLVYWSNSDQKPPYSPIKNFDL
jgi:hypothetical protein